MTRRCIPLISLLLLALPATASADRARAQSLGGVGLLMEDSSNLFTNPGLIGRYSDRAWFSLGVVGAGADATFTPHGGAAVTIGRVVDLGVVLNRSPQAYDFGNALWPAGTLYLPAGPGGLIQIPNAPTEPTAPLRFPIDLFVGFGQRDRGARVGINLYYAGGVLKTEDTTFDPESPLDDVTLAESQSHLASLSIGVAAPTDLRVRPEAWIRGSFLAVTSVQRTVIGQSTFVEGETTVDRATNLDSDVRVGAGVRVHIGDPTALRGVVWTPAAQYDVAPSWYHFNDEHEQNDAERVSHQPTAHDLRLGLGVAARLEDLRILGSASFTLQDLRVRHVNDREGTLVVDRREDVGLPEVTLGAEYRLRPFLLVRGGLRTSLVGGRTAQSTTFFDEDVEGPVELRSFGASAPRVPILALEAHGGVGIEVRRMTLDATLGGLLLGADGMALIGRMDLGFHFR